LIIIKPQNLQTFPILPECIFPAAVGIMVTSKGKTSMLETCRFLQIQSKIKQQVTGFAMPAM
jgi:hypothetical protein